MKIFVFGNINAGKSYFIKTIKKRFPLYKVLKIDDYRMKYGDYTFQGEQKAQKYFVDAVRKLDNVIVECTGLGPVGIKLAEGVTYKKDLVLFVKSNLDDCVKRIKDKDFALTPYPKVSEKLEETIIRCHKEFEEGHLEKIWENKVLNIIPIFRQCDIDSVLFSHYEHFSRIIQLLSPVTEIQTIYPHGSFARGELTDLSDIDCYIVTKMTSKEVGSIIENSIDSIFVDYIDNKVTIRHDNDLLIELMIVKKLNEGEEYIKRSLIKNPQSKLIKSSKEDLQYLSNENTNAKIETSEIDEMISTMLYYLYSLPKLVKQDNKYKYYFHNNIVVHNFARLSEISKGNTKHNYLPKVDFKEYKDLLVGDFEGLSRHYELVFEKVRKLLVKLDSEVARKHLEYMATI